MTETALSLLQRMGQVRLHHSAGVRGHGQRARDPSFLGLRRWWPGKGTLAGAAPGSLLAGAQGLDGGAAAAAGRGGVPVPSLTPVAIMMELPLVALARFQGQFNWPLSEAHWQLLRAAVPCSRLRNDRRSCQ